VMVAPARSVVSSSPQGSGGSSCRNTDLPLESPGSKTLFCGRSKIISGNDEIRKKRPGEDNRKLPS
jgi:hypothetical protein